MTHLRGTGRGDILVHASIQTPTKLTPEQLTRVAELEASERKLATERDILRKAAKYFAGETNW